MTNSNLFDINRDDEFIDELAGLGSGEKIPDLRNDPLFVDLSLWTASIDADVLAARQFAAEAEHGEPQLEASEASNEAGRHRRGGSLARVGRRSVRAGFVVAATGAALSFSGVAAAVNGGHLPRLPEFHFPATPPAAKGASVLADVPSAVPTSPGVRPSDVGARPSGVPSRSAGSDGQVHSSAGGATGAEGRGNSFQEDSAHWGQPQASSPAVTSKSAPKKWTASSSRQVPRWTNTRPTSPSSHPSQTRPSTSTTSGNSSSTTPTKPKPTSSGQTSGTSRNPHSKRPQASSSASPRPQPSRQGGGLAGVSKQATSGSAGASGVDSAHRHSARSPKTSSTRAVAARAATPVDQTRVRRYVTEGSMRGQLGPAASTSNDVTSNTTGE